LWTAGTCSACTPPLPIHPLTPNDASKLPELHFNFNFEFRRSKNFEIRNLEVEIELHFPQSTRDVT
jgi:hypothetical protein